MADKAVEQEARRAARQSEDAPPRDDSYVPTYRDFARGLAIVAHVKKLGWNVFKAHFPKPEWVALSYTESTGLLREVSFQLGSKTAAANELGGFGPIARQSSKENMRAVATQYFSHLRQTFPQFFDDPVINDYTNDTPSPEAAVTPPLRMRDDLNQTVKQAKAEALAPMAAALALARYEVLARHVDLLNPRLAEDERLRRAERLVKAYERARKANPDFRDTGEELRAARRIRMADFRQRKRAKLQAHEAA